MKVTINVNCTPEEARSLMGLPNVEDAQKAVVDEWQRKALEAVQNMDPQTLFQTWMSSGTAMSTDTWDQLQRAFWAAMPDLGQDDKKQ